MLATVPGFTALPLGTAAKIGFHPQWIVSNVGADYATVAGHARRRRRAAAGGRHRRRLPAQRVTTTADPWIQLFKKVNEKYNGNAPFDGNVEYGMAVGYMFVQPEGGART